MARLSVVVALLAFVAVAFAQNSFVVDDFLAFVPTDSPTLRISTFDQQTVEAFNCDATQGGGAAGSFILGGCHVLFLEGSASNGCEPTGSIANGDMFCNNAFGCAARCVLQLDGSSETTSTRSLGLNENLNDRGYAFEIFAVTDIATTFTIRVIDTSGNVSRAAGNIPANSSAGSNFVRFEFAFASDFTGSANFNSVGALELEVPNKFDTDVVITDWSILSEENDIEGNVFVDCNCDNARGTEDSGVASTTVTLTGDSSCRITTLTQTTDQAGFYRFTGLPPCTYTITVPSSVGPMCSNSPNPRTVVLSNVSINNVNFGVNSPSVFTVPDNRQVLCNAGTSPAQTGTATSSVCGSTGTVTFSDSRVNGNCDADYTILRTWTDGTNTGVQTITVVDTNVAPTFTNANSQTLDITIECNGCTDVGTCVVALTAVDDCSVVTVQSTDGGLVSDCDENCNQSASFIRTWTAVDDCGNQAASQGQVIFQSCVDTVIDCPTIVNTVPAVSNVPVNPPTRNCRFICDDDDSAASALIASFVLSAVLAVAALF